MRYRMIIILCFNYGNWLPIVEIKHIVGKFRLTASHNIAADVDSAISNLGLHCYVTFPTIQNDRSDIIQFDVFFRHLFLAQYGHIKTS